MTELNSRSQVVLRDYEAARIRMRFPGQVSHGMLPLPTASSMLVLVLEACLSRAETRKTTGMAEVRVLEYSNTVVGS